MQETASASNLMVGGLKLKGSEGVGKGQTVVRTRQLQTLLEEGCFLLGYGLQMNLSNLLRRSIGSFSKKFVIETAVVEG